MKVDASSIEDLIAKSGDMGPEIAKLDAFITDVAPDLERQLFAGPSITMIGYGSMPWQHQSGEGIWPLIGVAPQKSGVSVYIAADKDGMPIAEYYQARLGRTNHGKNCIRFKNFDQLDLAGLTEAVRDVVAWGASQGSGYGRACVTPVKQPLNGVR